jgi:two-component system phosphate regulon response regulator OmpR
LPEDDAAHLLVVDDDTRIRDLLSRYLTEQGFRVTTAAEAGEARRKLEGIDFDLLIIDVMMPGESGLSLTRSLREIKTVPILMLTALAEGEAGSTVSKPAPTIILPSRSIRASWCSGSTISSSAAASPPPKIEQVVFGPYTFVIARRELKKSGEPVRLTDREREIMVTFAENAGETVPAMNLPAATPRSANAPSMCRSTACGARSKTIPPTRSGYRLFAASGTG